MLHVSRTHRVNLDWLFESVSLDSNSSVTYVHSNHQTEDILTKGSCTHSKWNQLMFLCGIIVLESFPQQAMFSRCRFGSACAADGKEK